MTGHLCDVPGSGHDSQARLYACGWRCTSHAPQARTTATTPGTATAAPVRKAVRARHDGPLLVVGALRIDCGQGVEIKTGDRAGEIRWKTHPRARYECVACGWTSETVTGPTAVQTFAAHIRSTHQAACLGAITEGARAA